MPRIYTPYQTPTSLIQGANQFNAPPIQQPDIPRSLDQLFNAYLAMKNENRQQQAFDLQQQRQAGQDALQAAELGFSPSQATPETIAAAQGQPAAQESPVIAAIRAHIERKKQQQSLGVQSTEADINYKNAQTAKLNAEATQTPPGKQPAQWEYSARGFADKAKQADQALASVESTGFDPSSSEAGLGSVLPNLAKSQNVQQSEQAQRQFVNAILRRESGAAIPQSELENYKRQYFPMFGDTPAVMKQKREARMLAISGLEQESSRVPSSLGAAPAGGDLASRARQILEQRRNNAARRP